VRNQRITLVPEWTYALRPILRVRLAC